MFTNKNRETYAQITLSIVLIAAIFGAGFYFGDNENRDKTEAPGSGSEEVSFSLSEESGTDLEAFWKVWQTLEEKYVPPSTTTPIITGEDRVWGAIEGLAAAYKDPYTVFFPPVESKMFADEIKGSFNGVGMEIASQDGILTVVAPLKNTPADRGGVKSGDKIIQIDDKQAARMGVDEAISLIRGERGTTVTITFVREGARDPIVKTLTREPIDIPTIDYKLLPSGVYLIQLYSFSENSPDLFRRALREFVESKSNKLILDLRNNPGGYLEAAVSMASWFLPTGKTIVTEDFGSKRDPIIHRSRGYNVFNNNLEFVILINNGSASASEILAGALNEYGKATLIGENTFGKGSVQELVPITSETSLKVTVAHWLTPNGNSISNGGLKPNIEVKPAATELEAKKDSVLEKAVEYLNNK